jgi:hypothetical protein
MRKWNAILSISIVAVLLIPVMMAGSIASACCGVQPVDLKVSYTPPQPCIGTKVAIEGNYTVIPIYTPIVAYDTGVDLKVWNPDGVLWVKTLTLATGQTTAPKTFVFSDDTIVVQKLGVYKYEVIAWSKTQYGREQTDIVAGTILVNCIGVPVDIHPTSCPNPLNVGSKGVVPVAILGSGLDVTRINPASVRIARAGPGPVVEVAPLRWALEDVATPQPPSPSPPAEPCYYCNTLGPDGKMDLTLKFDAEAVIEALGPVADGDCVRVRLVGNLKPEFGGTLIRGGDNVLIIENVK